MTKEVGKKTDETAQVSGDELVQGQASGIDGSTENGPKEVDNVVEVATLRAELAAKDAQCEELAVQFTRLRADFDNFRRRTRTEMEDMSGRAAEKIITRLLPVLDNLDRAVEAAQAATDTAGIFAGVDLVRKGLLEILAAEGLLEVPGVGADFDPHVHEAVDRTGDDAKVVIAEYRKGYKLAGRVLRAAMVKVGPAVADTDEQ